MTVRPSKKKGTRRRRLGFWSLVADKNTHAQQIFMQALENSHSWGMLQESARRPKFQRNVLLVGPGSDLMKTALVEKLGLDGLVGAGKLNIATAKVDSCGRLRDSKIDNGWADSAIVLVPEHPIELDLVNRNSGFLEGLDEKGSQIELVNTMTMARQSVPFLEAIRRLRREGTLTLGFMARQDLVAPGGAGKVLTVKRPVIDSLEKISGAKLRGEPVVIPLGNLSKPLNRRGYLGMDGNDALVLANFKKQGDDRVAAENIRARVDYFKEKMPEYRKVIMRPLLKHAKNVARAEVTKALERVRKERSPEAHEALAEAIKKAESAGLKEVAEMGKAGRERIVVDSIHEHVDRGIKAVSGGLTSQNVTHLLSAIRAARAHGDPRLGQIAERAERAITQAANARLRLAVDEAKGALGPRTNSGDVLSKKDRRVLKAPTKNLATTLRALQPIEGEMGHVLSPQLRE
jgi:cellobiose-specific phosphotransferase system component IIA